MASENEAYQEGQRLLRQLTRLEQDVTQIDASDTGCKANALALIQESRDKLREALRVLAGIV